MTQQGQTNTSDASPVDQRERSGRGDSGEALQSQVLQKPKRRQFTTQYKLRILEELDAAERGQVGMILRREGLYSAIPQKWREWRHKRMAQPNKDNQKRDRSAEYELSKLKRENARLRLEIEKRDVMLDLQKKAQEMLDCFKLDEAEPTDD